MSSGSSLLGKIVATVGIPREHSVLQIYCDGRIFHIALAFYAFDDFAACERTFALQDAFDNIAHDTRLISPLLERVEPTADEDELSP